MRRVIIGTVLIALAGASAAGSAAAAPARKVCRLLTDARGDGQVMLAVPHDSQAVDLLSADIATGAKTLAVVVRVASLAPELKDSLGYQYAVQFTVGGKPWWVRFVREAGMPDLAEYGEGDPGIPLGAASAAVDIQTASVKITLGRKTIPGLDRAKLGGLSVRTYASVGGFFTQADAGSSTATYADRTPSCISPA